jgi:hypothetical protein
LEYLGLHNKPKAEVHPGHKLTDPKEEEEFEVHKIECNRNLNNKVSFQPTD